MNEEYLEPDYEEPIEIIEIWQKTDEDYADAVMYPSGDRMKRIVFLANGQVVKLEEGLVLERKYIGKKQHEQLL